MPRRDQFLQADFPGLIQKPIISADQRRPKPLQMKGFEFGPSVALRLGSSRVGSQAIPAFQYLLGVLGGGGNLQGNTPRQAS